MAKQLSDPTAKSTPMSNDTNYRRVIRCTIGHDEYCLETRYIQSIRQAKILLESASGAGDIVDHNGHELPVVRLDDLLGYDNAPRPDREHILIIGAERGPCALVVGGLKKAIPLSLDRFSPLPALAVDRADSYFSGVADFRTLETTDVENENQVDQANRSLISLVLSPGGLFSQQQRSTEDTFKSPPLRVRFNHKASREGQMMIFGMPHVETLGDPMAVALSVTQVLEVVHDVPLTYVPGARDGVLGITKWRDHLVTVVDVLQLLGFDTLPAEHHQRIVIARRADGELVGFHATANVRTVRLPIESTPFVSLPATTRRDLLRGCFSSKSGDILALPAIDRLLV